MKLLAACSFLGFALSLCGVTEKFLGSKDNSNKPRGAETTATNSAAPGSGNTSSDMKVERPEPTSAQTAAVANGKNAAWDEQGMSWTIPAGWNKMSADKNTFQAGGGGAFLIGNISNMPENFPSDVAFKAIYDQGVTRRKNGEIGELRYLELDGTNGVQWLETPDKPGDFKRLQWQAYRQYGGQNQLVNIILSTSKAQFEKNGDAMYGVLYSLKFAH